MINIYFGSGHEPETVVTYIYIYIKPHLNPTTTYKYNYYSVKDNSYYTIILLRVK